MEELFLKFDADGSGKLDLGEMKELFDENDIPMDDHSLKHIFRLIHLIAINKKVEKTSDNSS
jgi:Ca2+-binding EF-hand superfamily protein